MGDMSIDVTERAEVRVVRSRDEEFVAFVQEVRPYLFRTAYLLCGDAYRAEDLVQGTFERTYRSWHAVRTEPRAYARRVLVNLRTDTWRRTHRTDLPGDDAIGLPDTPDHAARVAVRDELVRALAQLPVQQRRVVVMRHLLDLTEAQVADELGRTVGTVKSANARGLENLRAILERADLADIPVPARDAGETLTGSRRALRRRRTAQAALGGVAALLVAFFLAGPVSVPGIGPVALPGSEWFRSLVGLERPDGESDAAPRTCAGRAEPSWLEAWCPVRLDVATAPSAAAGILVDETVVDDLSRSPASTGLTATLEPDGSVVQILELAGALRGSDPYPDRMLVLRLLDRTGESSVAHNGRLAGHDAEIVHVVRQGDRLAWLEVASPESVLSPWAVRVIDDVHDPEVRTLVESDEQPVPVDHRIGLSGEYLHLRRDVGQGQAVQSRIRLDTGAARTVVADTTAFAATPDGVEWATNDVRTGLDLGGHADADVVRPTVGFPPAGGYGTETVSSLAASEQTLAWALGSDLYVLDRASRTVTVVELEAEPTGLDVDGSLVAWTDGTTGYVLVGGRPYRLPGRTVDVGVAGAGVAWTTTVPGGAEPQLHRARVEDPAR